MDGDTGGAADPASEERVRRDLAELGNDPASAPDVPPEVVSRVVNALRDQPGHSLVRPRLRRMHLIGLIVGLMAAASAAVVGAAMLARGPSPTYPHGPTAEQITVSRPAADIPLSDAQIIALLSRPPDYGPLADPARRAGCLNGLGYAPTTPVLGAQPLDMLGTSAVLLLVPGPTPGAVVALAVEADCNAAHTGLLASTALTRP